MMLRYPGVMVCLQVHYLGRADAVYTECVDRFGVCAVCAVWNPSSLLPTDAAGGLWSDVLKLPGKRASTSFLGRGHHVCISYYQ